MPQILFVVTIMKVFVVSEDCLDSLITAASLPPKFGVGYHL